MTRFAKAVLIFIGAWSLASPASTSAPNTLTYQGRLIESGVPASGPRTVEIHLCPDAATPLGSCFSTGAQGVSSASGLFRTTFTVPSAVNLGTGIWWLNVSVGGTSLSPREQLTSSPFAVYASTAGTLAPTSAFGTNISTNVGINTPLPLAGLHLTATTAGQGTILVESGVTGDNPSIEVRATGAAAGANLKLNRNGPGSSSIIDFSESGAGQWTLAHQGSALLGRFDVIRPALPTPLMTFATDGRVGVGNPNPAARLHVSSAASIPSDMILAVSTAAGFATALKVMGDGMIAVSTRVAVGKSGTLDALDVAFQGDTGLRLENTAGGPASMRLFISGTKKAFVEAAATDAYVGTPGVENLHLRTNGASRFFIQGSTGFVGIGTTLPTSQLDVPIGTTTVSALKIGGGVIKPVANFASGTTLNAGQHVVIMSCTGPCTVTLPAAGAATVGQEFIIISNAGTNVITLAPTGTDTIIGPTSIAATGARMTVYQINATTWIVAN